MYLCMFVCVCVSERDLSFIDPYDLTESFDALRTHTEDRLRLCRKTMIPMWTGACLRTRVRFVFMSLFLREIPVFKREKEGRRE